MKHSIRRVVLASLLVGVFSALAGSGCAASISPRRGGVAYADAGYYEQQPTVVVAQPTYVQPTYVQPAYVQPTYYVAPSYGYYHQPSRVVVSPARGYYGRGYDRRGYYGGRQRAVVYAPGPAPRQRGVVYAPGPVRVRGPAVYVR